MSTSFFTSAIEAEVDKQKEIARKLQRKDRIEIPVFLIRRQSTLLLH